MKYRYYNYDGFDCWNMVFDKDEGLELHEHDIDSYHDTLVLKGKCLLLVPTKNLSITVGENERYDFLDDEMHHELIALEDNTEILNIYRLPRPGIANEKDMGWLHQTIN